MENLKGTLTTDYADRLGAITDNLANSTMPGYRRAFVSRPSFDVVLNKAHQMAGAQQTFAQRSPVLFSTDFTQGPLKNTSRNLDFAVNGSGFFVVSGDNTDYYTRNGHFFIAPDRRLITTGGLTVQGEAGEITIPSGASVSSLRLDGDGTLYAGDATVGRLRVVEFADTSNLGRVGPTLFQAHPGIFPLPAEQSEVVHKTLEGSNSSVFEDMAELIVCMRSFQSCHSIIKMAEASQKQMISELSV